jgi:Fe-S-cluster containining protein
MARATKKFYQHGLRFTCTGCGACCGNRGEYGFVYVTLLERKNLAGHLRISAGEFTRRYCKKTNGYFHLKDTDDHCIFQKGLRCRVYRVRPQQCRTWPFWRENMNYKVWRTEVLRDCPGAGSGKRHSPRTIETILGVRARR